jgi:hypothetical protein
VTDRVASSGSDGHATVPRPGRPGWGSTHPGYRRRPASVRPGRRAARSTGGGAPIGGRRCGGTSRRQDACSAACEGAHRAPRDPPPARRPDRQRRSAGYCSRTLLGHSAGCLAHGDIPAAGGAHPPRVRRSRG